MSAEQLTDLRLRRPHQLPTERLPSQEELHILLELLPDGNLKWKDRGNRYFNWDGRQAFTAVNEDGYRCGKVSGRMALAHRVVFKMVHGYEPIEVDHKDGNRLNNHPDNLLPADKTVNGRNQKLRSTNTSGVCGVSWDQSRGKWQAKIRTGSGKRLTLGHFDTLDEAAEARKKAETEHGYSPRHGENKTSSRQDGESMVA